MRNRGFPNCAHNDGLHFRQPWVMGVQEEVERLKVWVHEHENLLRECEALKFQVKYKTMCQMKTKDGVSSLFSHG
ncbi:hypothetical protein Bca4012_075659 [Brassica carinata]